MLETPPIQSGPSSDWDTPSVRAQIAVLYPRLRHAAQQLFRGERLNHTLQPTELAHEAAARMLVSDRRWESPDHFVASATRVMRHLLTDYARRRLASKRQAPTPDFGALPPRLEEVLALDRMLERLSEVDPRAAQVVEFRFFAGLKEAEIAAALGLSETTVRRDWEFARTWLYGELTRR